MLLGELVGQLLEDHESLRHIVPPQWLETQKYSLRPTLPSLREVLLKCLEPWDKSYFVCDALDECPESIRRSFILELFKLQELRPQLRLLFTSRDLSIIGEETPLEVAPTLTIRATIDDLEIYINHEVSIRENLRYARRNTSLKQLLIDTLIQQADGMYVRRN